MKVYKDGRGWLYKVKLGMGGVYKVSYQKDGIKSWKGCRGKGLDWRDTIEEAEADLEMYAKEKGLVLVEDEDDA